MRRIFADTSYWIALFNPRDELHDRAVNASGHYLPAHILTSEPVLTEFLNAFSDYSARLRHAAATAVISLRNSDVLIVPQTTELFIQSVHRYAEMQDKSWSLTDCSSFVIMEDHGVKEALTHDRHFSQAGFQALLH